MHKLRMMFSLLMIAILSGCVYDGYYHDGYYNPAPSYDYRDDRYHRHHDGCNHCYWVDQEQWDSRLQRHVLVPVHHCERY